MTLRQRIQNMIDNNYIGYLAQMDSGKIFIIKTAEFIVGVDSGHLILRGKDPDHFKIIGIDEEF